MSSSTSDRALPFNSRAAILEPEAPEKEALDCPVHGTINSAPTVGLPVAQQLADVAGTGLSSDHAVSCILPTTASFSMGAISITANLPFEV
jgi:hypothetical protein